MGGRSRYFFVVPFILVVGADVFGANVQAAQGLGRVNMQGSIIDVACSIAVDSRDQTIDMEVIPLANIIRDGQGSSKPFVIKLEHCVIVRPNDKPNWRQFQVTFDGDADGALFGVRGEASGVALRITDQAGHIVTPGEPLPLSDIVPASMQLNYNMKLVANNHVLKAGDYFSVIRFNLDYF